MPEMCGALMLVPKKHSLQQQQQQQQHKKQQARPGTTPALTGADEAHGCRGVAQAAARADCSRCVRRPGSALQHAAGGDAAAAAGAQQLLLWSAAHEIDGRPVTRNGECAR
jgi:hypothetical protein